MSHLTPTRFREADYERTLWMATIPEGVSLDDLGKPEYWAHIARRLKPWDRIEARAEDGSFWADLLVRDVGAVWAKVVVLAKAELTPSPAKSVDAGEYEIKWRGPQHKWSVIRKSDNSVLKAGCADKEEAGRWLTDHQKAMAA